MKTGLKGDEVMMTLSSLVNVATEKAKKDKFAAMSIYVIETHVNPVMSKESSIKDSTDNGVQYISISSPHYYYDYYCSNNDDDYDDEDDDANDIRWST
eukprot:12356871-Heterocapsa_arctica.AAC.1